MAADGVKTPAVLKELESHLREDVEHQVRSGTDAAQAFDAAAQRIGQAGALKSEFDKVGAETTERMKHAVLTFAGIPTMATNMNTTNIEPRWATYLKGAALAAPALFLWTLSAIFVTPKLQQICADTRLWDKLPSFWNVVASSIRTSLFFSEHVVVIGGSIILGLILLEWRSGKWPRYRRAVLGTGAFLLNLVVLFSIFIMFVAAIAMAPEMAKLAR